MPGAGRTICVTAAAVAVAVPAVLGAAAWPRWWAQIAPEQSAMTWLQSVVLAVAAVIAALLAAVEPQRARLWLVLAAGFAALTMDERFALHERLRDQILAPQDIAVPLLPWVAPGDFILLAYGTAGLLLLPRILTLFTADRKATRILFLGVALAVVAVGVDSIDPATWSPGQERVQQSLEECVELASDLSLLTALLLRLLTTMTAGPGAGLDVAQQDRGAKVASRSA